MAAGTKPIATRIRWTPTAHTRSACGPQPLSGLILNVSQTLNPFMVRWTSCLTAARAWCRDKCVVVTIRSWMSIAFLVSFLRSVPQSAEVPQ
jgi:hypothetical protein